MNGYNNKNQATLDVLLRVGGVAEGGREAGGVAAPDVVLQAEGGVARHAHRGQR